MQAHHGWHGGHVRYIQRAGGWLRFATRPSRSKSPQRLCSVYKGKDEDGKPVIVKVQETSEAQPAWRAVREVCSWRAPSVLR
jgi:hypothetical protein